MQAIQSRPSSAQQGDLQLLSFVVHAHRRGALGADDSPNIALLITDCFGDELEEIIERGWSRMKAVLPCAEADSEDGDTLLATVIDVAYQSFWLALTEAPGLCCHRGCLR